LTMLVQKYISYRLKPNSHEASRVWLFALDAVVDE